MLSKTISQVINRTSHAAGASYAEMTREQLTQVAEAEIASGTSGEKIVALLAEYARAALARALPK